MKFWGVMNNLMLASFGDIMNYAVYIILAILILLVMITVHELGHYIAGKIFGFGIEEFAIGFGPKIFSKTKKSGEKFSIRLLPLGGFCAFKGEDADSDDPTAFNNKKPWQRIIVLISGALMNYLLAIVTIILMFSIYGHTAIMTYQVKEYPPTYNIENSFVSRDVILKVNGKNVYLVTDIMSGIGDKKQGESVNFTILRQGEIRDLNVILREDTDFQNIEDAQKLYDSLGIFYQTENQSTEIVNVGLRTTGVKLGIFTTIGRSFEYSFKLAGTIFTVLHQLFTGSLGMNSLGGTITTVSVTANAIKIGGLWSLLNIAGFIGVNLAVFNLLPFPALDGSRALFTTIEWIRRKPINRKIEGIIHAVGFVLLLCFALFADLQQCF